MIYDCFTFFNELDLLEIRLHTLNDVVDKFVIAEATRTHSGKPKELIFQKNRDRFSKFADKIVYIVVDDLLPEEEIAKDSYNLPWVNENRQRNALVKGLGFAVLDDIVMVSDLDEIPRPEVVSSSRKCISKTCPSVRFELTFYNFFINFKNYSYPKWMIGTVAVRYGEFQRGEIFSGFKYDRYTPASENEGPTCNKIRFMKAASVAKNAGWHFSFLGGIDAIQKKLESFSHSEFAGVPREVLEERLRNGNDLFGRVGKSFGVVPGEDFPRYVIENKSRFSHLIFVVDEAYLAVTKWPRRMTAFRGALYRFIVALIPGCVAPLLVKTRDKIMKSLKRI